MRIIPPPKVGRWQVWWVSHYPSGEERPIGRYRLRCVARLIASSLNRQRTSPMWHYEARPVAENGADHA